MIIKKFVGKTEEEAVETAKKELGNGIVIMNVKTVKHKGLKSLFRSRMTEVTVALEEEKEVLERMSRRTVQVADEKPVQATARLNPIVRGVSSENIEKKLDSLQTLLENQFKSSQTKQEEADAVQPAKAQEEEKTEEKNAENPASQDDNPEQEKFIRLLYNTMIDNEVDEKYVNQILDE
ncbi:MAG: flagellar biosynthesis protein FlhF, partial [Acetatifactor sp.]|nr:flagellar biosynthesis protein FlhF [Acetatifactor sp.]